MHNSTIFTWIGLLISYCSLTSLNLIFKALYGSPLSDGQAIMREVLMLACVGILLWLIRTKEHLPLASIGLHNRQWLSSVLWALPIVIVSFAVVLGTIEAVKLLGWTFGESNAFSRLSLGTITLITIRAGVAEEIFMRGFIIERLSTITGKTWLACALSLIPFALFHYGQGPAGILISFLIGGILTGMYVWRRDLKSNILAHFLIDFIANVVPAFF